MKLYKLFDVKLNKTIIITKKRNYLLFNRLDDLWYHKGEIKYLDNPNIDTEYLFIHIPKTGGISFKFNILHNPKYKLKNKISIYHTISNKSHNDRYLNIFNKNQKMFAIIRNPIDLIGSSYQYFKNFLKIPNFNSYIEKYQNLQLKFLFGFDMHSDFVVKDIHYDRIINLIENNKLTVCVQGNISKIYDLLKIDYVDENYILNKTDDKFIIQDCNKEKILKLNNLDFKFYNYILNLK